MYYKIVNKESAVFQQLYALRTIEAEIEEKNEQAIKEKTGLEFTTFLGHSGQQNFRRVTQYDGFEFLNPESVDLKIWKRDKDHNEVFVPNKKTKSGREMAEFLANGLEGSLYSKPLKILGLPSLGKFTFPFIEICGEVIVIFLGDKHEPKDKDVVEITKKEFYELTKAADKAEIL